MALTNPKPFQWDYDGSCAPGRVHWHGQTFSVGIFQWIPKASGKGLKRSKVVKRIRGFVCNPQQVYDAAKAYIRQFERDQEGHNGQV